MAESEQEQNENTEETEGAEATDEGSAPEQQEEAPVAEGEDTPAAAESGNSHDLEALLADRVEQLNKSLHVDEDLTLSGMFGGAHYAYILNWTEGANREFGKIVRVNARLRRYKAAQAAAAAESSSETPPDDTNQ